MKLWYNVNEKNRIVEYSTIYNAIMQEIETEEEINNENYKEYKVIDNILIHSPIQEKQNDLYNPILNDNEEWIEGATLEEVQEFKRLELKNARDTEILSHYLYTNNHIYNADLESRNRLFQAQQLGVGAETNINWITADNQVSSVSNDDLVNIVNGIAYREQLAFNKFASKYTEVLNCATVDEVKNIKW